ncbi:MAG: hypothetical protein R3E63_07265 [Pseudomonadales bacterium]
MKQSNDKVAQLRATREQDELQRINRLTGLEFTAVPVSLLGMPEEDKSLAESLLNEAINLWKEEPQTVSGRG